MEMSNLVRLLIFCSYLCQLLYCCLFFIIHVFVDVFGVLRVFQLIVTQR